MRAQKNYQKMLLESVSYYDLRNENSYHSLLLGMCMWLRNDYEIVSNRESGEGRFDILLNSKNNALPSMLFELKYTKDENVNLEALAAAGMEQMKKKKYLKWWIAAVSAVFIVGAGIFVYTQYKAAQTSGDVATKDGTSASASDITWNGKTYSYNEHLSNFLFLGIDTKEKAETKTGQADAGQADALYLLSWNRLEGDITVISIPRDTMTQIETFGPGGKSLGKSKDHISLSYAYGDGGYESCELAENAVSELLYGLPIDGYCALNMDGLPVLTDSVGGVTVTVPNDSLAEVDPGYAKGAVVTLKGEDTEQFVRYRNTEISQSAIARMERQQEYIRAFGEALKKASADKALVTDLYKAIEPYMVTNMGKSRFVDLTESVSEGKKVNRWTIPGEGIQGKEYDEYVVDDDALYEKTVETFYVEKK